MRKETKQVYAAYSSFEQAKWLKEKRFNEYCNYVYSLDMVDDTIPRVYSSKDYLSKDYLSKDVYIWLMPEQWQVVEWLRINHDIWISVDFSEMDESFTYKIQLLTGSEKLPRIFTDAGYYTPQEAYVEAFYYIKENNLI
jgi:hypothetical protein